MTLKNFVNTDLVEVRRKFRDYYNGQLRRKYEELEPFRQKYLKRFWIFFLLFFVIAAFYVYACATGLVSEETYTSKGAMKLCFVYVVIAFSVCYVPISDYKEKTKLMVMDRILAFWGEFKSFKKGLVSEDKIKKSALFGAFNEQEQDDAFSGKYHDTEITVSEQKLTRVVQTGKGRRDKTIFKGVFIALRLNRKYKGNTVVLGKSDWLTLGRYNFFELFFVVIALVPFFIVGRYIYADKIFDMFILFFLVMYSAAYFLVFWFCFRDSKVKRKKKKQINLEDVIFSKKWKVLADDQVEARYVLTPALMERMLAVKKLFHGNRLDFSFWENNLLIAVHTNKDMFETTSLFKSALDYRKVQEVICQLYSVFAVIDTLKLRLESKEKE